MLRPSLQISPFLRVSPVNPASNATYDLRTHHVIHVSPEQGGARWLRERDKASVRAKVEHPFLYVKRRFGYRKVRYRGLAKNMERIALLLGFANLLVAGRYSTA